MHIDMVLFIYVVKSIYLNLPTRPIIWNKGRTLLLYTPSDRLLSSIPPHAADSISLSKFLFPKENLICSR